MKKQTIGIIGHTGMVGSEVWNYFKKKKYRVLGLSVDPKDGVPNSNWEEINKLCKIIFICVPTPYDFDKKKVNFKILKSVFEKIAAGKIIVIKSTVWPGTTFCLQKKYPKQKILFNPEFLSRSTSKYDFEYPDRQIVGYTSKSKRYAKKILNILPRSPFEKTIMAKEAELIKYAHNVWGSIRIMWANHLYEVSTKLKVNYEIIKEGFAASKYIDKGILRYMTIFHNGKRGYGGTCFPKDVASYIDFCKKIGVHSGLIKATRSENRRILAEQNISEKESEKY